MTVGEACTLLVDTVRQLSAERSKTAAYRLVAQQAIHRLHDQHLELVRVKAQLGALRDELRRYTATTVRAA